MGTAGLEATRWTGLSALEALAEEWRELTQVSSGDPLAEDFDWILAHTQTHAEPADVFGVRVTSAGTTVGLLALRREPTRGALALRRALLCGDGTFDADYLAPMVKPGHEREAVSAMLDRLALLRGPEALVLSGLPDDAPVLDALRTELDRRGWPRRESPVPCCAAPLPADFDAYLAGLKSRMRSKVRSALRTAAEEGWSLRWTSGPEELEADLETLYALHAARWRERGEPGSFADPARRAFYARFAPVLLRRGALRLALLERDGRAAAAQVGPVAGSAYYQLQEGFDPEFAGQRAATALRGLCIRHFIEEEGLRSYDFMAGVTRHKSDWGAEPRPCTTLSFALPQLRARLTFAVKRSIERWRTRRA